MFRKNTVLSRLGCGYAEHQQCEVISFRFQQAFGVWSDLAELGRCRVSPVLVDNCAEGGRMAVSETPCAMIVDCDIAGSSVLPLLKKLRESVHTRRLPVIAIALRYEEQQCIHNEV
jgi:hypothetical protein